MGIKSIFVRPQVGHDTTSTPPFLRPSVFKISFAERTSSTGSPVKDTRMVSPIPWYRMTPRPRADLMLPESTVPDSVIPTCRG